jgi:uncharacterized protein
MKAVEELSDMVKSPYLEVGMGKREIRALAKKFALPVWNKPSQACLASRLSYGLKLTPERLDQVEQAEKFLHKYVEGQLRVRHHGDLARIEVMPDEMPKLMSKKLRSEIYKELSELGFTFVTFDINGYKMGSQNAGISIE